jgi:hypothetical protein
VDPETQANLDALLSRIDAAGLAPERDRDAFAGAGDLLAVLRRQGKAVRVGEFHVATRHIGALITKVRAHFGEHTELEAGTFKALAGGVSRKHAIPLLEHLDRQKVTLRRGDKRILHPASSLPATVPCNNLPP